MRYLLSLAIASNLFAVLPSNTVWEVRTAGSINNGGCFVSGSSGTDFSQQNAAQYTFTDLVLVTGTTATSVSHLFVASDVGNCIHITAGTGFTAGFYEIVSVAAGVATFDQSAGTGGSTGGTYAVGGAIASPVTACTNAQANNTVWMKADGTYTVAATCNTPSGNSFNTGAVTPYAMIGYTTSRGDNGRVTWTTSTNSTDLVTINGFGVLIQNVNFSNTAGTRGNGIVWANNANWFGYLFQNLVLDGFNRGIDEGANSNVGAHVVFIVNVETKNSVNDGIRVNSANQSSTNTLVGVYSHANGAAGVNFSGSSTGNSLTIWNSILVSNTGQGLVINQPQSTNNAAPIIISNTDMSLNTSDGLAINSGAANPVQIQNCIFYNNGGFGVNGTTVVGVLTFSQNNAYGSNTSGARNNIAAGANDVTLTANPFTSSGTGDFSLNNTAGGGAALRGAGFPGVLIGGGTGHADIGALQTQSTVSSAAVGFPIIQ